MSNSISQFSTDTSTHSVVINPEETISVMDCKAPSNIQPVKASSTAVKHESYSDKTLLSDNTAITSTTTTTSKSHVDSTARLLGRIDKILLKLKNNEGIDPREV
ncbi:hypothetical protein WICPIJ_005045 [Wickerhamomyces pijperi]|uniref:Uncharacterized protein n=1 Tax=Wickerhamomyces pijperi TaxID=599730 RepID=A0A9P8Q6F5_WICPI|nr:hypothetical protein WICPIJ_005045 [Wickerhamomyces pijperi]